MLVLLRAGRHTPTILLLSSCILIGSMLQQINAEEIGGDCGNKISCRDCLDDDTSTCGWVPVEGCLKSCNIIADADCYNIQDFNSDNNNMTGDDICYCC